MEFRILGPLEVLADGGPVALAGAKPRAVLAVLALHANQPVSAERLALALWGEETPVGAVKTVQVHVSRLRKALGDPAVLETTPAGYRLRVSDDELDVERFERHVAEGRRELAAGRAEPAADRLRKALALWRGEALEEFAWAPFAPAESDRLEEQHLAALELRVEADLAAGRHAELVAELQQLCRGHPWRERLHGQLMLALYRSGRQADALAAYQQARKALVEELGIDPGQELHDLHQAMLVHDPALEAARPKIDTPSHRRGALPSAPTGTIGRGHEIRVVGDRLRAGSVRLLTLTGPGGVGKTRLALEVARAVEPDFADGARFVSLAEVERSQEVPATLVNALGVVPLAGESPERAVERFLAAKHLLLVVDNCEHLPAAAPFIARLPAACSSLTVLATSREPLDVHAEHVYPVYPLALPERRTATDPDALAGVDAVTLFCERARAHDPGFELDAVNADAVAEICRRVDGLPLAIELAAARCALLAPAEIADRLHGALGALGAGPRDAPARQHTLRATIGWSHALLNTDEQACFARFAVFAGGAPVEAAEAITDAGIDTLDRLVAKSLLERRRPAPGLTRLRMLETIREYAGERFATIPDREAVRERHYRHFLAQAQAHGRVRVLCGPSRQEHLARLDAETDNLRSALQWALEQDDAGPALELCAALGDYWSMRARAADAVGWIERALSKPGADRARALRVGVLQAKSWALWPLGRQADLPGVMAEAEAIARTLEDAAILAYLLIAHAAHESWRGRLDSASTLADEARSWAITAGDPWLVALAAWARALAAGVAELHQRVDQAASLLEEAGDVFHRADVFHWAAYEALRHGRDGDARQFVDEASPLVHELDNPYMWMLLQGKVGLVALFDGDTEAARQAFREQLGLCRELVVLPAVFEGLAGLAAVATVHDDFERAARLAGASAAHRYGDPEDAVGARLRATFLDPARTRYGADAWDAAASEGAALGFSDAIAYALGRARTPAGHPA